MHFWRNSLKTSLFIKKLTISERSSEILRKITFRNKFENEKIQRKFWIWCKQLFVQSSKMGQLLTKTVFLHKMSRIQLNYASLLFWSIFGLIHWKLLFLFKKLSISEKSTEILRKFVFLDKFEMGQVLKKIWICCKQPFLF